MTKTEENGNGVNKRRLGSAYENLAAKILEKKGYRILVRNFRCRLGEIDLIANDGDTIVFCEVKYRTYSSGGDPLEAVTKRKQRRIVNAARYYLLTHGYGQYTPCRFDTVSFAKGRALHLTNAFDAF